MFASCFGSDRHSDVILTESQARHGISCYGYPICASAQEKAKLHCAGLSLNRTRWFVGLSHRSRSGRQSSGIWSAHRDNRDARRWANGKRASGASRESEDSRLPPSCYSISWFACSSMPEETARLDRHSSAVDQYFRLLTDCKVRWQWLALPCTLPQTFPLLVGSSLPHTRQYLAVFIGQGELPSKCENRLLLWIFFQLHLAQNFLQIGDSWSLPRKSSKRHNRLADYLRGVTGTAREPAPKWPCGDCPLT